jgi:arylsulfatase A-like enzyme
MCISKKDPNVVLIVIDALRADHVSCYADTAPATPNIDNLAREGVLFENTYCTWNTTDQSLTTILTGNYPRSHGIINHGDTVTEADLEDYRHSGSRLLSERLQNHNNIAIDWMGRWFRRGFDYYGYPPVRNILQKGYLYLTYGINHLDIFRLYAGLEQNDASKSSLIKDIKGVWRTFMFTRQLAEVQDARTVTNAAINRISRTREPFFLFLHYWDVHTPYNCPRIYREGNGTEPHEVLREKYRGAVRYVDKEVGWLARKLKSKGVYDDTIFVVTADHGESHTEHNIYFDHHGLYETTTHVPLIIRYPRSFPAGKRVGGFVQHVDLLPTIMQVVQPGSKCADMDGKSLLPLINNEETKLRDFVYFEETYVQNKRGIRNDRYKYIEATNEDGYCRYCHTVHGGFRELYDLHSDPMEECNIFTEKMNVARTMRENLQTFLEKLSDKSQKRREDAKEEKESEPLVCAEGKKRMQKRFRSLGY